MDEPGEKTLHTIDSEEFPLQGEPATIEFDAKCDKVALWGLWVSEYYNGGWHEVAYIERGDMSSSYNHYGPYTLNRATTKIKIAAETGATLTRTFKNVEVTLAKYLELRENNMDFSAVEYGQTVLQQFTVDYSNLTGALDVELQDPSSQIEVRTTTLGEDCGDFAKNAVVQIRCTGRTIGTEQNTIVISNRDQRLEVPVSVTVIPVTQQITWNVVSPVATLTTDKVQLVATATSELPVTFTSADNNIAEPYQKEDGTWWLNIRSAGNVVITATQAGNTNYESTTTSRTYSISRVTPTIATLPTASATILPATLGSVTLDGGQATVDIQGVATPIAGTFAWQELNTYVERVNSGYTVVFTPTNTDWYNAASCTVEVPVLKTPQSITWNLATSTMFCNADITFDAVASSGLTIRYTTSDASIAYVDADNHLRIIKGGEVTITAHQDGDETYAAAAEVEKTLTINRFTPSIVSLPTAEHMLIGRLLSDASLSGGRVELDGVEVEGSFAWEEGNSRVETVAGVFERNIIFTPANANWYNTLSAQMNVVVEKYAPTINQSLTGSAITYGQALDQSVLSGDFSAIDVVKVPTEAVSGTYAWKRQDEILPAGEPSMGIVVFTPANQDWYNTVEFSVPVMVARAHVTSVSGAAEMNYGQVLGEANLTNTTMGVIDGGTALVAGSIEWDEALDLMTYYEVGTHSNLPVRFTPNDPNYIPETVSGTATLTVNAGHVFDGSNGSNWNDADNWRNSDTPDASDHVVIMADADIDSNVAVGGMTIRDGVTVRIKGTGVLLTGSADSYHRDTYGNMVVEQGGQVELGAGRVDVNTFRIEARMSDKTADEIFSEARSGEALNLTNLAIHDAAYYAVTIDPSTVASQGWYAFSVPFEVDARTGVLDAQMRRMGYGSQYAILRHNGSERAKGKSEWDYEQGTLRPGKFYMITVSAEQYATLVLRKKDGAPITQETNINLQAYALNGGKTGDEGWNGLGNMRLYHINIGTTATDKALIYHHSTNSFEAVYLDRTSFVVGSPFFLHTDGEESVVNMTAATHSMFYAPVREENRQDEFVVRLGRSTDTYSDQLYVSATDDATNTYQAEQELTKASMGNAKVAQMSVSGYGLQLCDAAFPLAEDGTAFFPLNLTSPKAQSLQLYVHQEVEGQTLYLTYEGTPVWNLSESAYTIDLNKGNNNAYGLLLRQNAPQSATGIDDHSASEVKTDKLIRNGVLYMLRDGVLYDAQGKRVQKQ